MVKLKVAVNDRKLGEELIYTQDHWDNLNNLRKKAISITSLFIDNGFDSFTYGSTARGDVSPTSDVDIVLHAQIPSYRVELILEQNRIPIFSKKIVQATPGDVVKVQYEFPDEICLTLLLTNFTSMPFEFYHFGGCLTHQQLVDNIRVPGVDKRLVLILPTEKGHRASLLSDSQIEAAKVLKVSNNMISQRMRVLERRDKVGRTGVFLLHELDPTDNVEEELRTLARKNRMLRRRLGY